MKNLLCFLLIVFTHLTTSAQFRVHFMAGLANYKGDLQQKEITLQNAKKAYTIGATYRITGHLALRTDLSFTSVEGNDADNSDVHLHRRNLSFRSNIMETSLMAEYDLFNLDNYLFTPYFFGGVGFYKFNPYTNDTLGGKLYLQPLGTEGQGLPQFPERKPYDLTQFNIPFGAGFKYAVSDFVQIGAEFGARKLFTDHLDDVSSTYVDENTLLTQRGSLTAAYAYRGDELKNNPGTYPTEGTVRGNSGMGDNFYFGEVRLTIRLPWFEAGSGEGRRKVKNFACPRF